MVGQPDVALAAYAEMYGARDLDADAEDIREAYGLPPVPQKPWAPGEAAYGDWTSDGAHMLDDETIDAVMAGLRERWARGCRDGHVAHPKDLRDNGGGWTNCARCMAAFKVEGPPAPTCKSFGADGKCVRTIGHAGHHESPSGMYYR